MKVYIHDEQPSALLEKLCLENDVSFLTPSMVRQRETMPQGYVFFLDQVDALLIEVTHPTQEIHFLLAQAVLSQKPTLCVYRKNQPPRELLSFVKQKHVPTCIKTFSYVEKTVATAVRKFIKLYDPDAPERINAPTVKFTLRLSPQTVEELNEYCRKKRLKKADFIRLLIKEVVTKEEWDEGG